MMRFVILARQKIADIFNSLSIKNKINLTFILVFSALLILLTVFVYKISSNIFINMAIENAQQNLLLVSDKFDITFDNVQNYSKAALINSDVQSTLLKDNSIDELTHYNSYMKVQGALDSIIQPRILIDSMIIYDFGGSFYDSGQIQGLKYSFPPEYKKFGLNFSSAGQKIWTDMHKSNYYEKELQQNIVTYVTGIINKDTGKPLGILETNVSQNYISGLYSKIKIGDSGEIFVVNKRGTIVSSKDESRVYDSVAAEPYFKWVSGSEGGRIFNIGNVRSLVISRHYDRLNWIILGVIPIREITKDNITLTYKIIIIGLLCLILTVMLTFLLSDSITKPIIKLKHAMKYVGEGDLEARVEVRSKDEVGALAEEFNRMIKKTSVLMESVVNEQKRKKEYELALLQSQINPHFLYNTLESICDLAELNRNEDIVSLVECLAMFYRGILSKGSRIITIGDEVAIAESYVKILKIRYGDQFDYIIDVDRNICKYPTIKLLLQPLIENSVYHGLRNKRGKGLIEVRGFIDDGKVNIFVKDNGAGIPNDEIERIFKEVPVDYKKKSFGLKSTDDRIKLYFGPEFGLEVHSIYGTGTTVKVTLPTNEVWGDIE